MRDAECLHISSLKLVNGFGRNLVFGNRKSRENVISFSIQFEYNHHFR
jgi:hypothetical protein